MALDYQTPDPKDKKNPWIVAAGILLRVFGIILLLIVVLVAVVFGACALMRR